jgi:hypothetical protein
MRIISKFHDYYDTAMGYGHDASVVFNRVTPELDKQQSQQLLNAYAPFTRRYGEEIRTKFGSLNYTDLIFSSVNIFFCGKAYYGLTARYSYPDPKLPELATVYDYQHMLDTCAMLKVKPREVDKRDKARRWWLRKDRIWWAADYFDVTPDNKKLADVMVANRHSIIAVVRTARDAEVIVCPQLKPFHFFKVLPPYLAFQELDMWLSGVLAEDPAMRMVKIEDKYRIAQHGFDKWSFRKQSEKGE